MRSRLYVLYMILGQSSNPDAPTHWCFFVRNSVNGVGLECRNAELGGTPVMLNILNPNLDLMLTLAPSLFSIRQSRRLPRLAFQHLALWAFPIWPWGKTIYTILYCTKYRDTVLKRFAVFNSQQSKINVAFSLTPLHAV